MEVTEERLVEFFSVMTPLLDERQRRLLGGATARMLGRGGTSAVARTSGMARNTVITGAHQVDVGDATPSERVRQAGGGTRCRPCGGRPSRRTSLLLPCGPKVWTVGPTTVRELLHEMGYSLQATSKQKEGAQHVDRDAQFRYINDSAATFLSDGQPVISVDAKKKELIGEYSNAGQEFQPKKKPARTNVHDFIDSSGSAAMTCTSGSARTSHAAARDERSG